MAIIRKYLAEIINIKNPIPETYVLTIKTEKVFKFKPGQFLHLALDEYDPSAAWPDSRCFSMQTPGGEKELKITYATKGKFTKRMKEELQIGKKIWLKLPYGEIFSTNHNKNNCVFIAGGTGITPFLSLFNDQMFKEYENPYLYLGVRSSSYDLYQDEINKSYKINSSFKHLIVNQETDGILNIENIFKTHDSDSTYFISGPPVMIKTFKDFLLSNKVNPENIRTDDWE